MLRATEKKKTISVTNQTKRAHTNVWNEIFTMKNNNQSVTMETRSNNYKGNTVAAEAAAGETREEEEEAAEVEKQNEVWLKALASTANTHLNSPINPLFSDSVLRSKQV